MKLKIWMGAMLLVAAATICRAEPLLFSGRLTTVTCPPACYTCPNDYCHKPLPCAPCQKWCGVDDYCEKPLPCVRCQKWCGVDDYCCKPFPRCFPPSTRPWYSCGSKDCTACPTHEDK